MSRAFVYNKETWAVVPHTTELEKHTGLCFRREGETRFLAFTRGALPSDRELQSMSEEVLVALLQRAVVEKERGN